MKSANYFNGGTGAYGGSFAGYHFEIICLHAAHPIAGTVQQITSLSNSSLQPKEISLPNSLKVNFKNEQITLQPNILYIPTKKNFESGDAFFLSNEDQWFVFQITVGWCITSSQSTGTECHLVFVVPARGQFTSEQHCKTLRSIEQAKL